MKKHVKVVITRKRLLKRGACLRGLNRVAHLLPCTISTDPEENIEIACALADSEPARTTGFDAGYWLAGAFTRERYLLPDSALLVGNCFDTQLDAWIQAQYLAWVADKLATDAGR